MLIRTITRLIFTQIKHHIAIRLILLIQTTIVRLIRGTIYRRFWFMCFVFIWEQRATSAPYNINWLVFITEMKSVYSAVRTASSNKAVCTSSFKQTATCATYSINWLVFITEMKSVYSAVRTGSLNKAVCTSSFKQTATCATYSINWLVFITKMKSVYSAVRTGSLNRAVCASSL